MEKNKLLIEELSKMKNLMNYMEDKKINENSGLIRHKKITRDDNGDVIRTEIVWLSKPTKIKGRNSDSEIPELNLHDYQEIFPSYD